MFIFIFPCQQTQFTNIQTGCSVLEKRQIASQSITVHRIQFLLHPLMTFKSRVSRSLLEARIDENNINEENHCELLIKLLRALLHTTLLVWLTLCAAEYSARPAFLMWQKDATFAKSASRMLVPMHWQLFMRQSCTLMQHSHAQPFGFANTLKSPLTALATRQQPAPNKDVGKKCKLPRLISTLNSPAP